MRRRRTIYHNDARHSYLWYFEPPMRLEDAWIPVDEVAGTAVDTFSYCVERGDGAYYPTKVGKLFAVEDGKPRSKHNYEWSGAAACMLSLMERGLDPLRVLVDRAHEHGMDFLADVRLQRLGGVYPELEIENGGPRLGRRAGPGPQARGAARAGCRVPHRRCRAGLHGRLQRERVLLLQGRGGPPKTRPP